ncbi:MAG: PAS domain-containing protein [Candidatus Erginobacter occultus]|nr:PAS domain-containing protein [Candidatus Erginobacter occultus]
MAADETIAGREGEIERLKRELAAYRVAAGQVGDHLREISRLNRKISRSRREKELLLATTAGPMRLIGPDFKMRWVNAALEQACGREAGDLEGEYCYRALPSEDCGTDRCLLQRVLAGSRPLGEEKVIRIDGRDRYYIVSASPFYNDQGALDGILEDFLDITDRKLAEDALRRSEELYRTFINAASDLVFVKDADFRYLMINETQRLFFNRPESEIVGRTDFDLMPPEAAENCRGTDREAVEKNRIVIAEEEVGGSIYEIRKFPLRLREGALGVGAFIRDITESKKAGTALKESEERYRLLVDGIRDSVYILDREWRHILVNDAAELFTGLSKAELLGKKLTELFPGVEETAFFQVFRRVMENREPETVTTEHSFVDRRKGWYEVNVYPVPEGILCISRDITERKRAERERLELERGVQRAQKLESLGVMAGGIAHDFNNILMVMLGNAELVLRELGPLSPARESLNDILTAGSAAAGLCQQMLSYTGKSSLAQSSIDLNSLIGDMGNLIRSSISRKAVLTLNPGDNLPPVEGDPSQIRQVVMNLLINASEALEEQSGYITLSTGLIDCGREELARSEIGGEAAPGRFLCLEVTDSGKGMDEATRRRIFEPFFSTKFTGRGLGLVSVLGIVRGHAGALLVESHPGRGSTFRVLLPVSAAGPAGGEEVAAPAAGWRGKGKVLLAEDEGMVRSVTGQMLRGFGLEVLEASDGKEALDLYRKHREDLGLVLLDLTMPGLDGGEVLREIRHIDPEAKVVICSGYSEDDLARRFDRLDPSGVLHKPYSLASLSGLLAGLLPPAGPGPYNSRD